MYMYCYYATLFYVRVFLILYTLYNVYDYGYDAYEYVHYGSNILIYIYTVTKVLFVWVIV